MSRTRYERRQTREQFFLYIAVAVWAGFITALLAAWLQESAQAGKDSSQISEPPETLQTAIIEVEEEKPVEVVVAEIAPATDLSKLPMIENATLTHYCMCERCCGKTPDHPAYGITASGRAAEPYVSVAVDPFLIELGSTVYVDYGDGEIKEYRADDTGSGVAGAHIDLCVSSHEEAKELGVKTVKVWYER